MWRSYDLVTIANEKPTQTNKFRYGSVINFDGETEEHVTSKN